MPDTVIINTDGASRGNPGPAAAGFVIREPEGPKILAKAFFIGNTTNNVAEYTAVIKALEAARRIAARHIKLISDSQLLVRQINGSYKVKSDQIKPLFDQVTRRLRQFQSWEVLHVTREHNKQADAIVNRALDVRGDVEESSESAPRTAKAVRLGVLISGGGTTLVNLLEYIQNGRLNAEVPVVISSRSTVAGVERARKAGLQVRIIRRKDHPDIDAFSAALEKELVAARVDLVIQAGWLCLWRIPKRYHERVMNIHPALLPSFGGKGMWGHHVHEAVLKAGCKVSGCTVHFCNDQYDTGPIIVQRTCPVEQGDTPDTLAARVFVQECLAYPEAIRLFAEGRLSVTEGRVEIAP